MKKVILSIVLIVSMILTNCKKNQEPIKATPQITKGVAMTDLTFGVRGNCGMCKRTIEKAANSVLGVSNAIWSVDKKKIDVSFNSNRTNEMEIHNSIAAAGYDTQNVAGNEEAYSNLPGCCKYDQEMIMNQSSAVE